MNHENRDSVKILWRIEFIVCTTVAVSSQPFTTSDDDATRGVIRRVVSIEWKLVTAISYELENRKLIKFKSWYYC